MGGLDLLGFLAFFPSVISSFFGPKIGGGEILNASQMQRRVVHLAFSLDFILQ